MPKRHIVGSEPNVIVYIKALDSSETDGSGKTGLLFGGFTVKSVKANGTLTAMTTQTIDTLGTYDAPDSADHIRIKELDNTDPSKGVYELQLHRDLLAGTTKMVTLMFSASGMADVALELQIGPISADVTHLDGFSQRAIDLAEIAKFSIANSVEPMSTYVADNSLWAKMLATGGDISEYDEDTDAQQAIRDAIVAANPQSHTATGASTAVTGTPTNAYTDTASDDGTAWEMVPVSPAVDGFGMNQELHFEIGTGRSPGVLQVNGYWDAAQPVGSRDVQSWYYNYETAAWVQLSDEGTDFDDASADEDRSYPLPIQARQASDGEVKIRFTSTSTNTNDTWYPDEVLVTSTAQEAAGLTAQVIAESVWAHDIGENPGEMTAGYLLDKTRVLATTVATEDSTTSFTVSAGCAVNDCYNGMLVMLEDETDDHYEVRRITDWTSGLVMTVDRAFGFTPVAGDHVYIIGTGYADVNVQAMADDVITAGKFDESTAFPIKSTDTGSTKIARTGADSDTLKTLSEQLDVLNGGSGAFAHTETVSVDGVVAEGVRTWFTTDKAGTNIVATSVTDVLGKVTLRTTAAGTFYMWRVKAKATFTNPVAVTVS